MNNWQDSVVVEETDIETDLVDCDPAKRPEKLSDKQRHYLIRTGPHQPVHSGPRRGLRGTLAYLI